MQFQFHFYFIYIAPLAAKTVSKCLTGAETKRPNPLVSTVARKNLPFNRKKPWAVPGLRVRERRREKQRLFRPVRVYSAQICQISFVTMPNTLWDKTVHVNMNPHKCLSVTVPHTSPQSSPRLCSAMLSYYSFGFKTQMFHLRSSMSNKIDKWIICSLLDVNEP